MKVLKLAAFFTVLAVVSSFTVSAQNSDFSGTWKLDRTKSNLSEYYPTLVRITIQIRDNNLLTERTYDTGDGQEYPFTENLALNGTESKITIYDMPRKIKATLQNGTVNFESVTTFYGSGGSEDFISKETWKVDKGTKILTMNFVNKSSQGEVTGLFLFNKVE